MARITVEDCIDKFDSRFELVLVASNRARKLHSGDSPTVEKDNDKNTVIALREIADETIPIDDMKNNLIEEYQTVSNYNEEETSLEYAESSISANITSEENELQTNLEKDEDMNINSIEEESSSDSETSTQETKNNDELKSDDSIQNIEEGEN